MEYEGKEYWDGLLGGEQRELTTDESKFLIQCMLLEKNGLNKGDNKEIDDGLATDLAYQMFDKRLSFIGVDFTIALALFVTSLCDRPGKIIMWAYTVNAIRAMNNIEGRPVTVEDFAHAFPLGVPTEESYEVMWESQKLMKDNHLSNLVDDFANWAGLEKVPV